MQYLLPISRESSLRYSSEDSGGFWRELNSGDWEVTVHKKMQATDLNQVTSAISVQRWKDGAAAGEWWIELLVARNREKGFRQRPRRIGREQSRAMEGKK